ncbi:MAG: ABC transporter ATP-binding protein [Acidobacteriia bacterium]|nr:ABC transporter ATP-binding protein [Terriglobia bacterium]
MNKAIQVRGLSKQYRLGERQASYQTLRDTLRNLGSGFGKKKTPEKIWALRDVSFDVERGEVVGVIGRNGAGKSTLLKILSRITEPTVGYADLRGRVGSLLEVGTGFHPELTGRENIFLNGAILGMHRAEIARKFDEIVAFAETEKFLDTPVKFYSTGMYMRLAFAVAAHLEPEILLVDEVLAVGDLAFQKKCLKRMRRVASEGKTVLLVSHNMTAIQTLADSAILMANGTLQARTSVSDAILQYHGTFNGEPEERAAEGGKLGQFYLRHPKAAVWDSTRPFEVEFEVVLPGDAEAAQLWCMVRDQMGCSIVQTGAGYTGRMEESSERRTWALRLRFPALWLRPGMYNLFIRIFLHGLGKKHYFSDPFAFEVNGAEDAALSEAMLAPGVEWTVCERDPFVAVSTVEDRWVQAD